MKKNTFLLAAFLILLIGLPALLAQESGQTTITGGNATVISPINSTFLGPADQQSINVAGQYVKQKLGENYYNQLISFESSYSYKDCLENSCTIRNEISFTYQLPFVTAGDPKFGPPPSRIHVITDDKGTIVSYGGPIKPYQFLISQDAVIAKAKSWGLENISNAALVRATHYVSNGSGVSDGYEIVWAVSSNDLAGECRDIGIGLECIYKGAYVDVDTGEIRGEFRINPLILSSGGQNVVLGEFFQGKPGSLPSPLGQILPLETNTVIIIGLIVAVLIFLIWYRFFRKKI